MGFAACCSATPPKAEHKSRMPVLAAMRDWGAEYLRGEKMESRCFMMGQDPVGRCADCHCED